MLRILLSPLLVVITILLIPSIEKALLFLPLIFALSISVVNYKHFKTASKTLGILLSVVQSYGVFIGLSITIYYLDEFFQGITLLSSGDSAFKGILLVTIGGYLAGILLFYYFTFLFRIKNKRFSYLIISICYGLVVLVMQVFSKHEFLQFGVEKFASYLISWIIFMSLGFNLSLNPTQFINLFTRK